MLETRLTDAHRVSFRLDRLQAKFAEAACGTCREKAKLLSVNPSIVWKLEAGKMPSFAFLARLRQIWPDHDTDYWLTYDAPGASKTTRPRPKPPRAAAKAA